MEIGGIDAASIVEQLMEIERIPLNNLEARKSDAQTAADALAKLATSMKNYLGAGQRLASIGDFARMSTTVSDGDIAGASVGSGATTGSLTFTVDQLARAHGLRSTTTVVSSSIAITDDQLLAVAAGTHSSGVASVRAGAGLGVGTVGLAVSQASAAASTSGSVALGASTVIDGSVNGLDLTVNGVAHSLTISAGTYDAAGLAAAVQSALDGAGVAATASVDADGELVLATTREGSAADIQVTGGTALASLGLTVDASAHTGTDGVFDVDGTLTVVSHVEAGGSVAVDTGAGILDVTLAGGLRVGESEVAVVDAGDRSLGAVAAAINGAKNGVTAAAVRVADGQWLLQLGATATGEDGQIAIDGAAFGGLVETSAAQNAKITIGSGPGAYSIEASGNTFTDVMGGVSLTAKTVSTNPVTVSVTRDDEAIASDVANLVAAANELIAQIKVQTRADPAAGTQGPLAGNATVRALTEQIRSALTDQIAGLTVLPSSVGIERNREGTISFDREAFLDALRDDPDAVARLFARGGTATGDVTFADASKITTSGTYEVVVSSAATRAETATLFAGGAVADTRVGVRIGSVTATYDVTAGQSRDEIVDGLNAAIAASGLDVIAEDDGTGLRLRADEYGTDGNFELNLDVAGTGTWDSMTGTDVVGTIDGFVAVGSGRRLSLGEGVDSLAAGLSVDVAAGITGTHSVDYRPGIAARVVEVTDRLTRADTGVLDNAQDAATRRVEEFNDQIERLEDRLFLRETNMRRQWASLQTILANLQNQGSWISGQLAGLNTNWG
jgi:flagellar hook-associated protein 2